MYLDKLDLTGRTALVTGGGRGIGLAAAEALIEAGASVTITASTRETIDNGRRVLTGKGHAVRALLMDVTDSARVAEVAKEHGALDILVCNAGVARADVAAEEVTDDHFRGVIDVNLNGVFWCCREFGKPMLARGKGAIVIVGSISGYIVNRPQLQSYYNASKAAVHQLSKSLAVEWADRGVRVNAIAPGYVETPMTQYGMANPETSDTWMALTPAGRYGQPHEVGSIVHFLASDASSLMTGAVVIADGGYTCW